MLPITVKRQNTCSFILDINEQLGESELPLRLAAPPTTCRLAAAAGEDRHAEEAVVADRSAGAAGEGELPEGEKQPAAHAPEGKTVPAPSPLPPNLP